MSDEEFARFTQLNAAYKDRFGFPFIFAVKGATKQMILAAFEERVAQFAGSRIRHGHRADLPHLPLPHRRPGGRMTRVIRGQTLSFGAVAGEAPP